jgi:choline dehydrogenase-like flavoprotein
VQAPELTAPERRLELALRFFTVFFLLQAVLYPVLGLFASAEFPFVANSFAKDGLFCVLCFVAAGDVRRNGWLVQLVVLGHVLIVAALLGMLAFGNHDSVDHTFGSPLGTSLSPTLQLLIWAVAAASVVVVLWWLYRSALKGRYGLRYLWPHQFRTAMALAEVLVMGPKEELSAEQIASGIDHFLASLTAQSKNKPALAFTALTAYPVLRLRPPFALMSPKRRLEFIERCFFRDVVERRLPNPVRKLVQGILTGAQQMVIIGYYGDPRTADSTGYVPFSRRKRYAKAMKKVGELATLDVSEPNEVDAELITADVAIVGSGAAGSVLAYRLAERGREVVLLEGGKYVNPRDFSEDERVQFANLLNDGGLQMSTDTRFQVLQGKCVGGSTVVNNAVCYDIPPRTLERWNDPDGLDAGIDAARFEQSFATLRDWLPVYSQKSSKRLQAGGTKMAEGIEKLGLDGHGGIVDANIKDCLGSGYCNIGCAYGKKLSALDNILPRAQRDFPGAVRIFSECLADSIRTRGKRATEVRCTLSDGRSLRVAAKTVVVAGGALASSLLLQRSNVGGSRAGTGLSFNVGAPLTADFDEQLNSFDGLQITHGYRPTGEDQLILESWFNPVGTQALLMPGWFSDHFHNMRRYTHLSCIGVVVGSQSNASIKPGFRGKGMKLDYEPSAADLKLLIKGTKLAARIHFASGALRVMPMTFRSISYRAPEELNELDDIVHDNTDIGLHTSHPQGGNAVSRDPAKGVVDERFRVHGMENLYVCDASVFPSSVTVNPQLTVMAIADYAAANME